MAEKTLAEVLAGEGYEPTVGVSLDKDGNTIAGFGRRRKKSLDDEESSKDLPDEPPIGWAEP
jgi:hypothetical protein